MKPGYEIIAHNILFLRKRRNESQEEFAKRFSSNQKNIQAYEAGINKPKAEFILELSMATGIPPYDLLNTKLKTNKEGKIINVNEEIQLRNARAELNHLAKNFEEEIIKFLKAVQSFQEKVNSVNAKNKDKKNKPKLLNTSVA